MSGISAARVGRIDQLQMTLHSQSQLLTEKSFETIQRNAAGLPFFADAWGVQKWPR
jgi:hypothetical protein